MRSHPWMSLVLFLVVAQSVLAQSIQITSFDRNGSLTWTNASTNAVSTVQWASALTSNTQWQQSWVSLLNIMATGSTTTVKVPMFYRVASYTNGLLLFFPMSLGGMSTYAVSNALGQTWTEQSTALGVLSVPGTTNDYAMSGIVGMGSPGTKRMAFFRSTDQALYQLRQYDEEQLSFTNAPVGTTWTNYYGTGQTIVRKIVAIETVTVPAGTFDNCLKVSNACINCLSDPNPTYIEWPKPGFGLVKWMDWWIDNPAQAPIVYRLQSVSGP